MDTQLLVALSAWALKEFYTSFIGSRATMLKNQEDAKIQIRVLQKTVDSLEEKIDDLKSEIRNDKERKYRA